MATGIPSDKEEFPPLLSPGRHPMSLDELRALCVDQFALSRTREAIYDGLATVVGRLRESEILGELWVDGSFLTEKIDPGDVDLVLRIQADFTDNANAKQCETLDWVTEERVKESHKCHAFITVYWPSGHPQYADGERMDTYWIEQWGVARSGVRKGFAQLTLSGGAS